MTEQTDTNKKSPIFLKVISVFLIFAGLSGILTNFFDMGNNIDDKVFQDYLASRTLLDKIVPYVINPLLILSAIYMFKGKLISIRLYLAYLVLVTFATALHILSTSWYAYFGMKGIGATTISLLITIAIYFYLRNIEKKGILIE